MDNARIHHSKIVKDTVNESTNKILYNVPYNPETNPIEFVFSILKNEIRKKAPSTIPQIQKVINVALKKITKDKLKNIYNHSLHI